MKTHVPLLLSTHYSSDYYKTAIWREKILPNGSFFYWLEGCILHLMNSSALKALLAQPGIISVPGAVDALTARLVEDAGSQAVYAKYKHESHER